MIMSSTNLIIAVILTILCVMFTGLALIYYHLYCHGVSLKDRPGESTWRQGRDEK